MKIFFQNSYETILVQSISGINPKYAVYFNHQSEDSYNGCPLYFESLADAINSCKRLRPDAKYHHVEF
jgi:hypothetical protein